MRLSERAQAVLFAAVLLGAIAGLWVAVKASVPGCRPGAPIEATLELRGGDWSAGPEARVTAGCTVYDLLVDWAGDTGTVLRVDEYGEPLNAVFVTQIREDVNGDGGRYWQFWVDCVLAPAGADLMPLEDGDRVTWIFAPETVDGAPC